MRCYILLVLISYRSVLSDSVSETSSLIVSTTESTTNKEFNETSDNGPYVNPKIYAMDIQSNISNRFATTLITSKVKNLKQTAQETTFSIILPENAYISEFEMEVDGKIYKAYVKEKKEAKKIYEEAVLSGQSAAHVELNARDSKTFTVSVNIEPESKMIFRLTYEELLQRQTGQYELVVNIHPGQIVDDLNVQVNIKESRPLTFVRTPSLRTGNEISKNEEKLNPSANIEIINATSAVVQFKPDKRQQKQFGELLGGKKDNGITGQFVVQYDVERDPQGGEVLVRDGYFVHFFSPSELKPLHKHVVFVLDHSGSMMGRKIEQLTEAMQNILTELDENDLFSMVRFSGYASVWNVIEDKFIDVYIQSPQYGHLEPHLREMSLPEGVQATKENVEKAKNIIKDHYNMGSTNIIAGLEVGLFLIKRSRENSPKQHQPIIVFLTDGLPNVGMHSGDEITRTITELNSGPHRSSIFSLSFGSGADKKFLRKLSLKNLGFSRHIFEAADASLQLQHFYKLITSPLLSEVNFRYVDEVTEVTKIDFPILFNGSELVVAGRISESPDFSFVVEGVSSRGHINFTSTKKEPVGSLERLWAYLTVKQILKERETATNATGLTAKALDLALKYSFVTSVTSLVVVKPNQTDSVDTKLARPLEPRYDTSFPLKAGAAGMSGMPGVSHLFMRSNSFAQPQNRRLARPYGLYQSSGVFSSPRSYFQPQHLLPIYHHAPRIATARPINITPHTTTIPPHTTIKPPVANITDSTSASTPPTLNITNATLPEWLEDIRSNNGDIQTPQGTFKLGKSGDVSVRPDCPKTPLNGTGECTLVLECPRVFSLLTDINVYLTYFCPLNQYAGVCCPKTTPV